MIKKSLRAYITGRRIIFICRAEKSADFPALLFSRRIRQKEPLQPKSAAAPVICDDSVLPLVVFAVGVFGGSHTAVLEHTFHHSAVLIGKADDDSLAAAGHMTEGQRPHVAGNDALFLFGDMEHLFCIDAGAARVGEAVHLEQAADAMESTFFMPVVQIKIVQESTDSQ